jgi:DNA mismatch repair protein MutL
MAKIKILKEEVRNRIAAGEVVERPASVVKELIENAIDANTKKIIISLKKAGKNLIKVTDDGFGMEYEDLLLSYKPHSTSKLEEIDDLNNIKSLGFRGEALSSIASISHLRIETKTKTEELASFIEVEAGKLIKEGKTNHPTGTSVEVRNIFFNAPVRKKFLRTDDTELYHILEIVTQYSLILPQIYFYLENNDKKLMEFKETESQEERLQKVLNINLKDFIFIKHQNPLFKLKAWFSNPKLNFPNRKKQYFYVNKRVVRNPMLYYVVSEAYKEMLPPNRHLQVILMLEMDPKLVDVNIHPTKREIKFRREKEIRDILSQIFKEKLKGEKVVKEIKFGNESILSETPLVYEKKSQEELSFQANKHLIEEKKSYLIYKNNYIIFTDKDEINIIDQHAAHEHLLFEKISENFNEEKIEKEKLLLPIVINLDVSQATLLKENIEFLNKCGIDIQEFGENSFILRAKPVWLKKDLNKLLNEVISDLSSDYPKDLEKRKHRLIDTLACHSAVKKGDKLSPAEIEKLIIDLKNTKTPYCPHGRPAIIKISWDRIEREFLR